MSFRILAGWFCIAVGSVAMVGCATVPKNKAAMRKEVAKQQKADQTDKLLQTEPAEIEKIGQLKKTAAYRVGHVTVLHKRTPANSVVSARLYLNGGSRNMTNQTAGLEKLTLNVATSGGTELLPKDPYNSRLNSMGSSIKPFTAKDFSGVAMKSVKKYFEPTWDIFTEAVLQPALPESEVKQQKKQQLASLKQRRQNPDRFVSYVSTQLLFGNHPYSIRQLGRKKSVRKFTVEAVEQYHRSLLANNSRVLVVVGDIKTDRLLDRVAATLGRLPEVDTSVKPKEFDVTERTLRAEKKSIPTNYILGTFPAPAPGSKEYAAMKLAVEYLSDRLFEEVRTKRNLTYAVSAGLGTNRDNYGYLYVTAKKPKKTMSVIFDEVEKLKKSKISEKTLEKARNVFITEHYMGMETNANQAADLAENYLLADDWRRHHTFIDTLNEVKPADVKNVAEEYFENYQFGVVGSPKQIEPSFFRIKAQKGEGRPKTGEGRGEKGDGK
jgi:predicted Zn-dependent peptidase